MQNLVIIGGGPAALLLAAHLDTRRYRVTLHEQQKTVGRKFLVAGDGGLNLTYAEPLDQLVARYSPAGLLAPALRTFTNRDLRDWLATLGISTFVGSSGRVFPDGAYKPYQVLDRIVAAVEANGVVMRTESRWTGWTTDGALQFADGTIHDPAITVFALGGASWRVTGSDGSWRQPFEARGIDVTPFRSANCAFGIDWPSSFREAHAGRPLKNIALRYQQVRTTGELTVTDFGLEGNAIYPLSEYLQAALTHGATPTVELDLKPMLTVARILDKLKNRNRKPSETLRRDLRLDRTALALLKQFTDRATFLDKQQLTTRIKALPLRITAAGPLDEAISTIGGVAQDEVDAQFQLKKQPGTYVIGEMLDWYAPTGGYLLQGCFSMGVALAKHLNTLPDH